MAPSPQYYGRVRFLNASTTGNTVNISIDGANYAINSRFGTITNYERVADGFHTVTVRNASGARNILYQSIFPFMANEKSTMVLVDGANGLNMVKLSDTGCRNILNNMGCYRVANMSYPGSSFDVILYGDSPVFRNVSFQRATNYKQAVAGSYQFYVTNSSPFTLAGEIPVIVIGNFPSGTISGDPLLSLQVDIDPGRSYTTYLIGNDWSEFGFRAMTVAD